MPPWLYCNWSVYLVCTYPNYHQWVIIRKLWLILIECISLKVETIMSGTYAESLEKCQGGAKYIVIDHACPWSSSSTHQQQHHCRGRHVCIYGLPISQLPISHNWHSNYQQSSSILKWIQKATVVTYSFLFVNKSKRLKSQIHLSIFAQPNLYVWIGFSLQSHWK